MSKPKLCIAGVAVLSKPVEGYVGLSILFSVVILAIGISQLIFSVGNRQSLPGWGWTFVSGIIDIVIGLMGASFDLNSLQILGWGWLFGGGLLLMILSSLTCTSHLRVQSASSPSPARPS